jgi:chemotaxis protein CheD
MAVVIPDVVKVDKDSIVIGMGEYAVSSSPSAVLTCIGLGSCIAVCAYDRVAKIGGMIHIVLPQHQGQNTNDYTKFADTGVPLLFHEMIKKGGDKGRLVVKIAGGAQMTVAPGLRDTFKTGERNLVQILTTLEQEGLGLKAADVGGNLGRTVKLHIDTGTVIVKTVNGTPREI